MPPLRRALYRIAAALACVMLALWLWRNLPALAGEMAWWIASAALLYLASHLLRALRLLLLVYDGRVRFREVARAHLFAAGTSRLLLFKLGEFYRIALVDCLVKNPTVSVTVVLIERLYDVAFLALILASGLAMATVPHPGAGTILVGSAAFLGAVVGLLVVVPELLPLLKRYLVLRHNSDRSLVLLRAVDRLHLLLGGAVGRWHARWGAVTVLSALIWTLEAGVLALAMAGTIGWPCLADAGVEALLTLVLEGRLEVGSIDLGIAGGDAVVHALSGYVLATAVPLAVIALLLGLTSPFRRHPHPPVALLLDRHEDA